MFVKGMSLALTGLQAVSGYNSVNNYDINYNLLSNKINEKYNNASINNIEDIYSLIGENKYLKIDIDDKYLIVDKEDYQILEEDKLENDLYRNFNGLKIYFDSSSDIKYFGYKNNNIYDLKNDNIVNLKNINYDSKKYDLLPKQDEDYEENNDNNFYYGNMKYCDNHFYFEKLTDLYYAKNEEGTCPIVAFEILLSYYDTFLNDNIVEERYEYRAFDFPDTISEFSISPGSDNYTYDTKFHDFLIESYYGEYKKDKGFSNKEQLNIFKGYLKDMGLNYKLNYSLEDNLSDMTNKKSIKVIKNSIDKGRPVIADTFNHSMVAYAYNDDYLYVHTGWGYIARIKWKFFKATFVSDDWFNPLVPGAFDIEFNIEHVHSDNYHSMTYNIDICPCDVTHIHDISTRHLNETYHIHECSCGLYQREIHNLHMEVIYKEVKSSFFNRYYKIPVINIYCETCNYNKEED